MAYELGNLSAWFASWIEIVLWCIVVALPTRMLGNALRSGHRR